MCAQGRGTREQWHARPSQACPGGMRSPRRPWMPPGAAPRARTAAAPTCSRRYKGLVDDDDAERLAGLMDVLGRKDEMAARMDATYKLKVQASAHSGGGRGRWSQLALLGGPGTGRSGAARLLGQLCAARVPGLGP